MCDFTKNSNFKENNNKNRIELVKAERHFLHLKVIERNLLDFNSKVDMWIVCMLYNKNF